MIEQEILKDLIEKDKKEKQPMLTSKRYYAGKNKILDKDFRKYFIDGRPQIDYNKSNEHIVNNFHKKLIDQKTGYIAGKPLVIKSNNEDLQNAVIDLLGERRHDIFYEWVKGASI